MKIFLIDVIREEGSRHAEVSIMSLELGDGKFRYFKRFNSSSFEEVSHELVFLFLKHRPDKIFVEDTGLGIGLSDYLDKKIDDIGLQLLPDGTIVYS